MIRRIRVNRPQRITRTRPAPDTYADVCNELQLIANIDRQIEDLTALRTSAVTRVEDLMTMGKLKQVDNGVYTAKYAASSGRSTRIIDPKLFKKAVDEKAFWQCIKVSVTEAKEYMTEREIDSISEVHDAKPGEPKLVVGPLKKGKK